MRLLTALAALLVSFTLCSVSTFAAGEERSTATFIFTAIPDQDESRLQERFGKVAAYLAAELGIEVKYIPVKNYPAAITAFRNNQVQLAWFGGLSGVQARALVPDSKAIAQGYEDQLFKTYFIAHKSAEVSASEEFPQSIQGKSFTFGSKGSTSGRLMPEFYIRKAFNKAPEQVFTRVGFSGDHSRTLALVSAGAFQVGALNYSVWDQALKEGKIDKDTVNVIWTTPTYPDYQWSVRGDVDETFGEGFTKKLTEALLSMKDKSLLDAFPRSSFVPADNSFYQPIEDTAKALDLMADY
ncbi:putative selenate ABC transporter substrate-binding protein [Aurantivibrio infirmus]